MMKNKKTNGKGRVGNYPKTGHHFDFGIKT